MKIMLARVLLAGALVLGPLAPLGCQSSAADPPKVKFDTPTTLAKVLLPYEVNHGPLAWSADGAYLAVGRIIVDAKNASIIAKLKVSGSIVGLTFSPDGKFLVVATGAHRHEVGDKPPRQLSVFDVPAFTRKFTASASGTKSRFYHTVWSADGKALCWIEYPDYGEENIQVRRWDVPAFNEQPAISIPRSNRDRQDLAVSPDGNTLAVADQSGTVRLYGLPSGAERISFKAAPNIYGIEFAPNSKTVAIFNGNKPSWFDAATGKPEKPNPSTDAPRTVRLAAISPDGSKRVAAGERSPTIIFQKRSKTEHGVFIQITSTATGNTWNWRVGEGGNDGVAFSPDGTKLAGKVRLDNDGLREWLMIWAVPK